MEPWIKTVSVISMHLKQKDGERPEETYRRVNRGGLCGGIMGRIFSLNVLSLYTKCDFYKNHFSYSTTLWQGLWGKLVQGLNVQVAHEIPPMPDSGLLTSVSPC